MWFVWLILGAIVGFVFGYFLQLNIDIGRLRAEKITKLNSDLQTIKSSKMVEINNEIETKKQTINALEQSLESWKEKTKLEKTLYVNELETTTLAQIQKIKDDLESAKVSANIETAAILEQLQDWQSIDRALEEERLRRDDNSDAHFLVLSTKSKREIEELLPICAKLSNPTPLYKAMFELYYRNPYKDMVVKQCAAKVCGIYKITNINSGRVYVGQSVDIGNRWLQHIKRGTGCDSGTISGSKLYDSMMEDGIWNFRFEILEEVDKSKLTEREHYYIKFFNAVETGYNMKG